MSLNAEKRDNGENIKYISVIQTPVTHKSIVQRLSVIDLGFFAKLSYIKNPLHLVKRPENIIIKNIRVRLRLTSYLSCS